MRSLMICLLGVAGTACAFLTPRTDPVPMRATDSAEYARLAGDGQLELCGQAFLTTASGEVKPAAGREVTLDPATAYARAWFRRFGADSGAFEAAAPDRFFMEARRTTRDAWGR